MFILATGQINTILTQNTEALSYQFSSGPAPARAGICTGCLEPLQVLAVAMGEPALCG